MFFSTEMETGFLHLILIFLLAGFHRNTSKSQTFQFWISMLKKQFSKFL